MARIPALDHEDDKTTHDERDGDTTKGLNRCALICLEHDADDRGGQEGHERFTAKRG